MWSNRQLIFRDYLPTERLFIIRLVKSWLSFFNRLIRAKYDFVADDDSAKVLAAQISQLLYLGFLFY